MKTNKIWNTAVMIVTGIFTTITLTSCPDNPIDDDLGIETNEQNSDYEGSVNGHDYVDLGLSVKWAKTNLGTSTEYGYGNYYAWGETITKTSYWIDDYKFFNRKTWTINAPTTSICGTNYDAATLYWGNDWRMPTKEETEELLNNCTWEESVQNGISGFKVIGKNGKYIFLPKTGSFTGYDKGAKSGIFAHFWTGTYAKQSSTYFHAYGVSVSSLNYNASRKETIGHDVYDGFPIRPVTKASGDKTPNSGNNSGGGTSSGDSGDFYETNFNSTEYSTQIKVDFYFSEKLSSATIYYGTTNSCKYSKKATVSGVCATTTLTGLTPGTKCYFKCTAKSKNGQKCTTGVYPAMTTY